MEERHDPMEWKYDRMDERYDRMEWMNDRMEERYDPMEWKYDRMEERYDPMEWKYDPMEEKYDPMACKGRLDCIFVQNAPPYVKPWMAYVNHVLILANQEQNKQKLTVCTRFRQTFFKGSRCFPR